jgi:hypothetical protein
LLWQALGQTGPVAFKLRSWHVASTCSALGALPLPQPLPLAQHACKRSTNSRCDLVGQRTRPPHRRAEVNATVWLCTIHHAQHLFPPACMVHRAPRYVFCSLQVPLTQQHGVQEAAASGASAATDRPPSSSCQVHGCSCNQAPWGQQCWQMTGQKW